MENEDFIVSRTDLKKDLEGTRTRKILFMSSIKKEPRPTNPKPAKTLDKGRTSDQKGGNQKKKGRGQFPPSPLKRCIVYKKSKSLNEPHRKQTDCIKEQKGTSGLKKDLKCLIRKFVDRSVSI